MSYLIVSGLSYRLENGESLFADLSFTITQKITGLVGRNGSGKSTLAAILAGELTPYAGTVTHTRHIGFFKQISSKNDFVRIYPTIADALQIRPQLAALKRIEQGNGTEQDVNAVGDEWRLFDSTCQSLSVLGLPADPFIPLEQLSGGQLTRLILQPLFTSQYDYLILDEPSNHLDRQGKQWLMDNMQQFTGGILLVSHDREILDHVEAIFELTSRGIHYYGGNYSAYITQRDNERAQHAKRIEHTQSQLKQLQHTAQKNREKAQQRAIQGKKLSRSGSQAKVLLDAKKESAESSSGTRENQQTKHVVQMQQQLSDLTQQHEQLKPQKLVFEKSQKQTSRLLDVMALRLPYGSHKAFTFSLAYGEKVALHGDNGSGKSTLLNVIAGKLAPLAGKIHCYGAVHYLDQHFSLLDPQKTALENIAILCPHLTETDQRTLLAGIGLRRDKVNQYVFQLSGGERMKVAMLAVSHQPGEVLLLLDEPDNHLDLAFRQILAQALNQFNGSVIVVSHDRHFLADIEIDNEIEL